MNKNRSHLRAESIQPVDPIWFPRSGRRPSRPSPDPLLTAFLYGDDPEPRQLERRRHPSPVGALDHPDMSADLIGNLQDDDWRAEPEWSSIVRSISRPITNRDLACDRFMMPLLYFKGIPRRPKHRLAQLAWQRQAGFRALFSRAAHRPAFPDRHHPHRISARASLIGHATGLVVWPTAVFEEQRLDAPRLTLGGTGTRAGGDRHPKIRKACSSEQAPRSSAISKSTLQQGGCRFGRCSNRCHEQSKTVAGVPARIVGEAGCDEPSRAQRPASYNGQGLIVTGVGTEVRPSSPLQVSNSFGAQKARHTPPTRNAPEKAT